MERKNQQTKGGGERVNLKNWLKTHKELVSMLSLEICWLAWNMCSCLV